MLEDWAAAWGIPAAALDDLRYRIGALDQPPAAAEGKSEAAVQGNIRLEAARRGYYRLWRNNVGALVDSRGVPIRYGLANDTKAMNAMVKSADLIGVRRVLVTPQMVGRHVGLFTSIEAKWEGWRWGEDKTREGAQLNWALLVLTMGGDARFMTSPLQLP